MSGFCPFDGRMPDMASIENYILICRIQSDLNPMSYLALFCVEYPIRQEWADYEQYDQ